ncbi:MAG: ABC transporter substrate-binding protein [Clostridiales bacterium]|nr:ABC transporter substrate-binding protein [Clostridiales bacterium]
MMKKTIAVCMAAMMAMSIAACGGAGGSAKGGDDSTFIIGSMGPTSGANASYGTSVKNGAQIAVDEINEAGGINGTKFELKFEDDQADAGVAANAYSKLYSDNMDALLGATTSNACQAVNKLAQKDNILMVTPSGSTKDITDPDNVFRICFTDPLQGEKIADLVTDTLGYKNIAVLYDVSSDYGVGIHDAFVKQVKAKGAKIVSDQSFTSGDKDFNTQLTSIKSAKPDVIFVPGYYQEASFILTQAKQLGIDTPFVGSDGWDGVTTQLGTNANIANGAIFLSPFFSADSAENVKNFVAKYQEEYKAVPDQFAADAYDGVYAIAKAYEKAGSKDTNALIKAMKEIEVEGVTGKFSFDKTGEPNKDAKYIQIQKGEYTIFDANKKTK